MLEESQPTPSIPTCDAREISGAKSPALLRFAAAVGTDFDAALREYKKVQAAAHEASDADYPPLEDLMLDAHEHVLAMPIRRAADVYRKAEYALRFCCWHHELQEVLTEIVSFKAPDRAATIIPADFFG